MYSRWLHPSNTVSPRPYCRSRRGRNGFGSETIVDPTIVDPTVVDPTIVYSTIVHPTLANAAEQNGCLWKTTIVVPNKICELNI